VLRNNKLCALETSLTFRDEKTTRHQRNNPKQNTTFLLSTRTRDANSALQVNKTTIPGMHNSGPQ
jgi:hypothetical protein